MGAFNFQRFIGICGRLGSDHDGERANAAAMATRELRAAGLTWVDVLVDPGQAQAKPVSRPDNVSPFRRPDPVRDMLADLFDVIDQLTPARQDFVHCCRSQASPLSDKQCQIVSDMWHRHFGKAARA
jgi:hypothetical protein